MKKVIVKYFTAFWYCCCIVWMSADVSMMEGGASITTDRDRAAIRYYERALRKLFN